MVGARNQSALPAAVLSSAGAAAAFYGWAGRTGAAGAAAAALLCILAVLVAGATLQGLGEFALRLPRALPASRPRTFRAPAVYCFAAAFGLCVGTAAAWSLPGRPGYGQAAEGVAELTGRLAEDPRRIAGGRVLAVVEAVHARSAAGVRTGARGRVTAFLPEDAVHGGAGLQRGALASLAGSVDLKDPSLFRARRAQLVEAPPDLEVLRSRLRRDAVGRFRKIRGGELLSALLLGCRDDLDEETAKAYRSAGCSHILALSGMHLGVLSALAALILKRPLGLRGAAAASSVLVLLFVLFVGPQPSLLRAGLMFGLGALALIAGLPRSTLGLLSAAFLLQLLLEPAAARSLSFILSYLALLGILVLARPVSDLAEPYLPKALSPAVGASVGAFLATAAVSAAAFGILRPAGILAGIPAAALASVLMVGALAWTVLDALLPILSPYALIPLEGLLDLNASFMAAAGRIGGIAVPDSLVVLLLSLAPAAVLVYLQCRGKRTRRRLSPFDRL